MRCRAEGLCIDQEGYIQEADDYFHTMGVRRNIRCFQVCF